MPIDAQQVHPKEVDADVLEPLGELLLEVAVRLVELLAELLGDLLGVHHAGEELLVFGRKPKYGRAELFLSALRHFYSSWA
jgi:hypothetical protein